MFRKRHTTPLKIILGITVVYFGFLFLSATNFLNIISFESSWIKATERNARDRSISDPSEVNTVPSGGKKTMIGDVQLPIVDQPIIDRLRLAKEMHRSAEEEKRQPQRLDEGKTRLEVQLREMDQRVNIGNVRQLKRNNISPSSSSARNVLSDKQLAVKEIQPLLDTGLVVVKWNGDNEVPVMSGGQGEYGAPINITAEDLPPAEKIKFDVGWKNNQFNQYASDMMSLHRSLPDVRDVECRPLQYRDALPTASVVITFHDEAWSVLLRTVHSVMDRSPPHLIKEIILVDDFSSLDHLKKPLEDYMAKLLKVRILRKETREGLIRARLLGASMATGEVLVFLDSHCECAQGWLEPLLDRIAENRTIVVAPTIDTISDKTLQYIYVNLENTQVGGFSWSLVFNWHQIPERELKRRARVVDPVWSPTMAGGLFAISREYFEYLGTYDAGMEIWGGENLELSFRIWMCGGTLEQVLCSHVGHIFRDQSPYAGKSTNNFFMKNNLRLAEVWMDEYKNIYYEQIGYNLIEYGDVSSRKELRKKLQCKSFDWYLKNVFPELFIPTESLASGEIRNKGIVDLFNDGGIRSLCIDGSVEQANLGQPVTLWPCHNQGGHQYWMLSEEGEIRRDEACLDYTGELIVIYPCHGLKGNQLWSYRPDDTLLHINSNSCIEMNQDGIQLEMKPCTGIDRQKWYWKRKNTDPVASSSQVAHAQFQR